MLCFIKTVTIKINPGQQDLTVYHVIYVLYNPMFITVIDSSGYEKCLIARLCDFIILYQLQNME